MVVTTKLLKDTVDYWTRSCSNIMDSQKKFNQNAMASSIARLEAWIKDLEDAHA